VQIIFGTLSITGLTSILLPQDALLLLAGFPDPAQAARAATNFIVNVKGIPDGSPVAVTGTPTTVGTQPAIVMTDINTSGGLEQHAPEAMASSAPRKRKKRKANS
jgi:hypothetical protein